jgi:tRNA (Thr-GGU) A37 N-methylase
MSLVRLRQIKANHIHVLDIDVVDGTPLLDIKPYVPRFDNRQGVKTGWLEGKAARAKSLKADDRFAGKRE